MEPLRLFRVNKLDSVKRGNDMAINSVSDIKIIITGGASGIGAATATLLAQDGAHVMIADVDEKGGKAVAEKLGKNVIFQKLDVTNADD